MRARAVLRGRRADQRPTLPKRPANGKEHLARSHDVRHLQKNDRRPICLCDGDVGSQGRPRRPGMPAPLAFSSVARDITPGVVYPSRVGSRAKDHSVKGAFTWRFDASSSAGPPMR